MESFVKEAFISRLAFPDDKNAKTKDFEMLNPFAISILVALKLRRPVGRVGLRLRGDLAIFMGVPEAAMDEDCPLLTAVSEIRVARKVGDVLPEPQSQPMRRGAYADLRRRVFRSDSSHDLGACKRLALVPWQQLGRHAFTGSSRAHWSDTGR